MANTESDPRVFFAAERTLLAWLRTGLTIIGLGFVVSRFGLFIKLLGAQSGHITSHAHTPVSAILGIFFVLVGSLSIAMAAIQHRKFVSTLTFDKMPAVYTNTLAFALSIFVSVLGLALAVYLWIV